MEEMTTSAARRRDLLPEVPPFATEIAGTLAVHSQYVLHGNLRDQFLVLPEDGSARIVALLPLLWKVLQRRGFEAIVCYDAVDGLRAYPPDDRAARQAAERVLGGRAIDHRPTLKQLRAHLAKIVGVAEQPPAEPEGEQPTAPVAAGRSRPPGARLAVVVDYAARITRVPGHLDQEERDFFLYCQKLAHTTRSFPFPDRAAPDLHNPILWLADGERDLPAWYTAGVEQVRTVAVGLPTLDYRLRMAELLVPAFPPAAEPASPGRVTPPEEFANRTEGMTLEAMRRITQLAKDHRYGVDRVADATRVYKLGIDENPWRKNSVREQIIKGEKMIAGRVMGQARAIAKTLDILKRAALGLSGAQASTPGSRPRGVLFFAGPTGVGKTELAKQVAEILFGDAQAYLRFDMSEFSAEQAADRLIGAPPGYVGFEAGGELTGAVRRRPFQVVLFDEIEKAHPLVLDKFLQILEDGRLTDGQGVTTHFSECVLIFTSNLGIIVEDPATKTRKRIVEPGTEYPTLEATVKQAIRDHFTSVLGRPELLNRFGDNIVVFDFIDTPTADRIFTSQLDNIVARTHSELGITLEFTDTARRDLGARCTTDPDNGGRGVGNKLETHLVNSLARALFDRDVQQGARVVVTGVDAAEHGTTLTLDVRGGGPA